MYLVTVLFFLLTIYPLLFPEKSYFNVTDTITFAITIIIHITITADFML